MVLNSHVKQCIIVQLSNQHHYNILLAPTNLKVLSIGPKNYTISWDKPSLANILKYHASYRATNGSLQTLSIQKNEISVTIDVEYDQYYTFTLEVETEGGKSDAASIKWTSHSGILQSVLYDGE